MSDGPDQLFDFLETTHSETPVLETPCRKLLNSFDATETPAFLKASPVSTNASASSSPPNKDSPDSSKTSSTTPPPSLPSRAPEPGKKFGFGNAFKALQFRSKSTDSNLGDKTSPTKSDMSLLQSEIEKAREAVKNEKKNEKGGAADPSKASKGKPGPVGKAEKVALLRQASSNVLGLAAAVSSLKLSPADKAKAKPKARGRKAAVAEEAEKSDVGSADEDEAADEIQSPVSYEQVDSDEEINKTRRVAEEKGIKEPRKKKQPKANMAKGKAKAKSEPKPSRKGASNEPKDKKGGAGKKQKVDPVQTAEQKKRPCMESFLAKEWIRFKDEKLKELKGTKPYQVLLKEISALWKTQPARKQAAAGLSQTELKRVLKDPQAIPCRWDSDQCVVVLEVTEDGSRRLKDTKPCTIRALLTEFEANGMVETTLNGHEYVRPEGNAGDVDFFEVTPEEQNPLVFKFSAIPKAAVEQGNVKYTSLASLFNNRELMDSKMLQLCWRVSYSQDDQD
ncbi:unnamed protein product [Symbiodinium sp. CCMP2456]|nr:unnamed protein product [Symbiodinium sp. CCMP2456]